MASFGNFNIGDLPAADSFDPIPEGWYTGKISKIEVKETKDGTGIYLNIQYKILAPTQAGRVIYGMINVSNKSPKAEEVGRKQLGQFLIACGFTGKAPDSDLLVGIDVEIKVGIDPAKDGYEAKNSVKAWKAVEGSKITTPSTNNFGKF